MLRVIFCYVILLSGVFASADQHPQRMFIKPNVELTVKKYFKETDVFEVVSNVEPEAGPFYVTPDSFKEGVEFKGTLEEFFRKIEREPGAVYPVKKKIPLLWDDELPTRKKKTKNSKTK